jgi:flagellar basal body-associated protein FliL
MVGDSMKKQVIIIVLILLLLSLFAGCVYVNPLVQAGEQKETPDQTIAIQVC